MKNLYANYIDSFKGLSKEVWWLALITLINRAGTMVIPFLSLYLINDVGLTLENVGIVMSCFGAGSLIGSWLGGTLTDKFGYYKVMLFSLFSSGVLFVALQFLHTYESICAGIFILMIVADCFRPAAFVALIAYSKPENKTRSVTLIRLAINLGFSAGPAVGGIIITSLGYVGLFWVDGLTCILASILLLVVLNPKKARVMDSSKNENPKSAYGDGYYWVFVAAMILFGFCFVQYFSTVPIYYSNIYELSEFKIGLLLAMNGFLIFAFEMPLIKYLEKLNYSKTNYVIFGLALVGLSFLLFNLFSWAGILVIGMLLMTLGEMIAFPFSNAIAMERSKRGNQGEYMALYSIAFSISHIFAHNYGMHSIANNGYTFTWNVITIISVLGILLLLLLKRISITNK
ncbi:MFS transporter [Cellulophaga fucicola]|uniref:Predicted arabinose efflux permease, MFS family n=1 Tax=Cellulophaga fucicola TaxID=76595 RepID=A0A1K1R146_9FLAO|nr:MFS transporter [Cellulophaga fucicola]SFW65579.1 Predicted arabinose efflux permease, MFS family [Cellulophaga fucicola]